MPYTDVPLGNGLYRRTITGQDCIEDADPYSATGQFSYTGFAIGQRPSGPVYRTVMRILTSAIPKGSVTDFKVYVFGGYSTESTISGVIDVYKVTDINTWVEPTQSGGTENGVCTWSYAKYNTQPWAGGTSSGCGISGTDYEADASPPSLEYPAGGNWGARTITLKPEWVEAWASGVAVNNGVFFRERNELAGSVVYLRNTETSSGSPVYFTIDYYPAHSPGVIVKPNVGAQIKKNHRLAQGLVGCWLFNEGSGTTARDYSEYGGHAINNQALNPPSFGWEQNTLGYAMRFPETSQKYFTAPWKSAHAITGSFSVSCLVNVVLGTTYGGTYVSTRAPSNSAGFEFGRNSRAPGLYIYDGTEHLINSGISFNDNEWVRVTAVLNTVDQKVYFYFNGSFIVSKACTFIPVATTVTQLKIGAREDGYAVPNGLISDVMFWNRALSLDEIQSLYYNPYSMFIDYNTPSDPFYWINTKRA